MHTQKPKSYAAENTSGRDKSAVGRAEAGKTEKGASQVEILEWMVNEGLCKEGTFGQRVEGSQRTGLAKWLPGGRAYEALEQQVQRPGVKMHMKL